MTDIQTTHAPGCWGWGWDWGLGPKHYECAVGRTKCYVIPAISRICEHRDGHVVARRNRVLEAYGNANQR